MTRVTPPPGEGVHVLHVITSTDTGGAERMLERVCRYLRQRDWTTSVICLRHEGVIGARLRDAGVPVVSLDIGRGRPTWAAWRRLRQVVAQARPGILQGWMFHGDLAALLTRSVPRQRPALAWNVRGSLADLNGVPRLTRGIIRLNALMSSRADAVIYNSHASRSEFERIGYARERGMVIPNGFDTSGFAFDEAGRSRYRNDWRIDEDCFVFGCVARYDPLKNHRGLIESFAAVHRDHARSRLVLVGPGIAPDNLQLRIDLERCGVRDSVILVGETNDVPALLSAMDAFCLVSTAEGFPNALGEAMACARVCITTDVGDAALLVGNEGRVIAPGDATALTATMRSLIGMPSAERTALGLRARARVVEHFTIERVGERYAELYRTLLRSRRERLSGG